MELMRGGGGEVVGIGCFVSAAPSVVQIQFCAKVIQALTLLSLLSVSKKETCKQLAATVLYTAWSTYEIRFESFKSSEC